MAKAKAKAKATKTTAPKTAPKTAARSAPARVDLGAITAALRSKDGAGALDAALAAWRACKAPELADLIDAISARISGPPVTDDGQWNLLSIAKDPLALGPMLAGIREIPVSSLPTAALRLAAFDDPRVATAARGWILDPPCTSTSAYPFWTKLLDHLGTLGDTRLRPAIAKRRKMKPPVQHAPWMKNPKPSQFWGKFYKAIEALDDELADVVVPRVDAAAIAKLDKSLASLRVVAPTAPAKPKPSGQANGPPLARALALLPTDIKAAIDALLDAWRAKRAPELADLIERASRLLPSYRRSLPPGDKPAHAAWKAAYADDPIANLPLLLANVHRGGSAAAIEHVSDLSTLADDPRIALRLAEVANSHTISPQKVGYWKVAWALIARTGDTRVCAPMRRAFNDFQGTYYDHHRSGKRLLGDFLLASPSSPLDADDHKAINQIAAALANVEAAAHRDDQERALIADIVTHWADEGPRLVYADWLTEREHPRGELIVLSCKQFRDGGTLGPSEKKRFAALHGGFRSGTQVFGPISDLGSNIDRGLPVEIELAYNASTITLRRLAGDVLLPCVESIGLGNTTDQRGRPFPEDLARVMNDPTATRLTEVTDVPEDATTMLASELEPLVNAGWKRSGQSFTRR